jgi:hypothetical protein
VCVWSERLHGGGGTCDWSDGWLVGLEQPGKNRYNHGMWSNNRNIYNSRKGYNIEKVCSNGLLSNNNLNI